MAFLLAATKKTFPIDGGAIKKHHMHELAFIAGALAILSTPALAECAAVDKSDKPMVIAEEGISVSLGDHGDRDRDHHRVVVIHHHDDEDHHHRVVVIHRDHDDHH